MRSAAVRFTSVSAAVLSLMLVADAQERAAPGKEERAAAAPTADPRVGLKPGLKNAGEAARNMERVASMPKPDGFFDPKMPAGLPTPPERERPQGAAAAEDSPTPTTPEPPAESAAAQRRAAGLSFSNSDLAFKGDHLIMGNFNGFNTYDIEDSKKPRLIASVVCPGGQGDVSIYGHLLIMSVEQTRGRIDCGTQGVQAPVSAERFRGIRIFDITDIRKPQQVAAVQTCRGSHTHTLVTDPKDTENLYVYGSGTSSVRSAEELAGCSGKDPKEDPNTALFSIDVIKIPLAAPDTSRHRQPPADFRRPEDRRPFRTVAGRQLRAGNPDVARDQPVSRHHRISRGWSGCRRLRGQRHPARYLRSRSPRAPGSRLGQELCVLAFGHVQQRRHQGDLHR